jgi:hypothetical protein
MIKHTAQWSFSLAQTLSAHAENVAIVWSVAVAAFVLRQRSHMYSFFCSIEAQTMEVGGDGDSGGFPLTQGGLCVRRGGVDPDVAAAVRPPVAGCVAALAAQHLQRASQSAGQAWPPAAASSSVTLPQRDMSHSMHGPGGVRAAVWQTHAQTLQPMATHTCHAQARTHMLRHTAHSECHCRGCATQIACAAGPTTAQQAGARAAPADVAGPVAGAGGCPAASRARGHPEARTARRGGRRAAVSWRHWQRRRVLRRCRDRRGPGVAARRGCASQGRLQATAARGGGVPGPAAGPSAGRPSAAATSTSPPCCWDHARGQLASQGSCGSGGRRPRSITAGACICLRGCWGRPLSPMQQEAPPTQALPAGGPPAQALPASGTPGLYEEDDELMEAVVADIDRRQATVWPSLCRLRAAQKKMFSFIAVFSSQNLLPKRTRCCS